MNVNWNGYEIYHPGAVGPAHELPRSEARREFEALMKAMPGRIEMLRRLLAANGVALAGTDAGIQDLNDWFFGNVEPDPDRPGRLLPEWYSVARDVVVFLGDSLIGRCPGLRWEFFTWGKKDVAYQHHVIMGFSQVPNPKYNLDFERRVPTYGHRVTASRGSVAQLGRVTVRGVDIDLDAAIAARARAGRGGRLLAVDQGRGTPGLTRPRGSGRGVIAPLRRRAACAAAARPDEARRAKLRALARRGTA